MSNLKMMLLGTPEAYHDEQRLLFPDRKTLALLVYLATENGLHKRQKLENLLWPESNRTHGRTALRITLHHLRRVLAEDTHAEHEAHLTITHDSLGLHMDAHIGLDLRELEAAWKLVQKFPAWEALQGEARRALIAQLQHVVTLYRGGQDAHKPQTTLRIVLVHRSPRILTWMPWPIKSSLSLSIQSKIPWLIPAYAGTGSWRSTSSGAVVKRR